MKKIFTLLAGVILLSACNLVGISNSTGNSLNGKKLYTLKVGVSPILGIMEEEIAFLSDKVPARELYW